MQGSPVALNLGRTQDAQQGRSGPLPAAAMARGRVRHPGGAARADGAALDLGEDERTEQKAALS